MTIPQAIAAGLAGDSLSRTITRSSEVSAGRSVVAASTGALLGATASGAVVMGATAVGAGALAAVAAPVVVPVAVLSGAISLLRSFWD